MESILVPVSTLWAEVASSHFSLVLYLRLSKHFWSMLTDSEYFKSSQLSKTSCGYVMNFGLAPYFKYMLHKEIKASNCFGVIIIIIIIIIISVSLLHGAFKSGIEATDLFLNKILKAMWKIFDDYSLAT